MLDVDPSCSRCPDLCRTRRQVVRRGPMPTNPQALIVGRDPGEQEDKEGVPFVGPAGQLLREIVHSLGLDDVVVYTNSVRCHTPKNRGPSRDEVENCRDWLRLDVLRVLPRVIVTLGQEATEAVLGSPTDVVVERRVLKRGVRDTVVPWYRPTKPRWPLAEYHGRVAGTAWGIPVIPAYHPSAGLRNASHRRTLVGDLRAVAAFLGLEGGRRPQWVEATPGEVPYGAVVAIDTESSMETGRPIMWSAAWRDTEVHATWGRDPDGLQRVVRRAGRLVMHNAKYDLGVLEALGVRVDAALIDDTMLMGYCWRHGRPQPPLGLKERAAEDLGLTWPTLEELGRPEELPHEVLAEYGVCDVVATLLLWEQYQRLFEEERYTQVHR